MKFWKIGLLIWIAIAIMAFSKIKVIKPNGLANVKINIIEVRK